MMEQNVKSLLLEYCYKHDLKLGNICSGKDYNPFPVSKSTIERALYKHNLKYSTLKKLIDFLEMDLKGNPIVNSLTKKYEHRYPSEIDFYKTISNIYNSYSNKSLLHLQEQLMDVTIYIESLLNKN